MRKLPDGFAAFGSWEEVLIQARERRVVWYHAPLPYYPSSVCAEVKKDGVTLLLTPAPSEADPFERGPDDLHFFLNPIRDSLGFRDAYLGRRS